MTNGQLTPNNNTPLLTQALSGEAIHLLFKNNTLTAYSIDSTFPNLYINSIFKSIKPIRRKPNLFDAIPCNQFFPLEKQKSEILGKELFPSRIIP